MSLAMESAMGLSRRFLNLIVDNSIPGVRSLCCIDLAHQQFFRPRPPTTIRGGSESAAARDSTTQVLGPDAGNPKNNHADAAALMMDEFQLPDPIFSFRAEAVPYQWNINCFPFGDRKVICADQSGRAFPFDADTGHLVTMPSLKPKSMPISLFVPSANADADYDGGGSLYVLERVPKPEAGWMTQPSDQFEAFICRKPTMSSSSEYWHSQLLPPPLFVRDRTNLYPYPKITSYAVVSVGDRPHICVSTDDAGTYIMDTANHTWTPVGKWMLPFYGKVDYVPELKLWFGLSAETGHLAAADLSNMDSQPQLVDHWKELDPPEEWHDPRDPQLVNLGSGRFCIARFFETMDGDFGDELMEQNFVVLTGVKVTPRVHDGICSGSGIENGKVNLEVTTLKPRCHMSDSAAIDDVF